MLNSKIKQLNTAIDNVSTRLKENVAARFKSVTNKTPSHSGPTPPPGPPPKGLIDEDDLGYGFQFYSVSKCPFPLGNPLFLCFQGLTLSFPFSTSTVFAKLSCSFLFQVSSVMEFSYLKKHGGVYFSSFSDSVNFLTVVWMYVQNDTPFCKDYYTQKSCCPIFIGCIMQTGCTQKCHNFMACCSVRQYRWPLHRANLGGENGADNVQSVFDPY